MIASLPMYDRVETAEANDALWILIRAYLEAKGIAAPRHLERGPDPTEVWLDGDLLLSQTCGLPFRRHLSGRVTIVGTPDYGLASAPAGHYCSHLVARCDDSRTEFQQFDGATLAFNSRNSQSGWVAAMDHAMQAGIVFKNILRTGSHASSAVAVFEESADVAAIDVQSWRLIQKFDSISFGLKTVTCTRTTPGLPFITAFPALRDVLFQALAKSLKDLPVKLASCHPSRDIVYIPEEDYLHPDLCAV